MKLPFGEIKRDYKSGYSYREYEVTWYGAPVTAILDQPNHKVIYDFREWARQRDDACADYRIVTFQLDEFIETSYRELNEIASYCLFV